MRRVYIFRFSMILFNGRITRNYADRFVLTLINNRVIKKSDFDINENEVTLLNDTGLKIFFYIWQEKKRDVIKTMATILELVHG